MIQQEGHEITGTEILVGGRNSRVLRLELRSGECLIAKRYAERRKDRQDPLVVEQRALSFLAAHGVPRVPQVQAVDSESRWILMSALPGRPISSLAPRHGQALLEFLTRLDHLVSADDEASLGPASEASFSLPHLLQDIQRRFDRLGEVTESASIDRQMLEWLTGPLSDSFTAFHSRAEKSLRTAGLDPEMALQSSRWRLSPSDLGLHNMLEGERGEIFFVDFEYFGWDDPAKTLCDLALHPRALPEPSLRAEALDQRLQTLRAEDPEIDIRLAAYYPLFGLKWCLILLNEFTRRDLARRRSATGEAGDPRPAQLEKSMTLLRRLHHEASPF